jgi:2-keto-4-pentenoate hydratase/2-oxohepta-3-ene-1,7-dioic acid hydratase in catechol pathway
MEEFMRWIRFTAEGRTSFGILEGDRIAEMSGDPFSGAERTRTMHDLDSVRIEVPFMPRTFYCVGLNYIRHIKDPKSIPTKPDIGYRAVNAMIPHGDPVIIPADATKVQYEGELAVVIGKRAKNLSEAEALSCVLGYTIGNDVSERNWQRSDRTLWRAKNTDTFKPTGPWIETDVDLDAMQTTVRVNGETTTRFATNDMLFGVSRFISAMTRYLTLYPGDVIWMGTDGSSPDLKPGDIVEIDIAGIGTLRNPFVAEGVSAREVLQPGSNERRSE